MVERVFAWSSGRRFRIVVAEAPGDCERLFDRIALEAQRIDDRERLADEVSAIFNSHVRIEHGEVDGVEEIVLRVG